MDQGSKSSLKILGVVALIAIVGVSAYSMMRKNSLEQTGKVYEGQQLAPEAPCGWGSSTDANGTGGNSNTIGASCNVGAPSCNSYSGTIQTYQNSSTGQWDVCCNVTVTNESVGGNNYSGSVCVSAMGEVIDTTNAIPTKGDNSPSTGTTKATPTR